MINKWHDWLDLPRFDKSWYEKDLADELAEYHDENNYFKKWSELSDVAYTVSRSQWSESTVDNPFSSTKHYLGVIYMVPKYTGRYFFYRTAGRKAGANKDIKWIRNPKKLHKLKEIVDEQDVVVDIEKLIATCEQQKKYWPLLP